MWWLIAALVLAVAAGVAWLIRSRRRRHAWMSELGMATDEVGWFARVLLPQLARASSAAEVAGGWTVAAPRVAALEDHLTRLESTAHMDDDAIRARTLRDAVRDARLRMNDVPSMPQRPAQATIAAAVAELETALTRTRVATGSGDEPPAQPGG